jgi:ribosomal protein S19
MKIKKSIWKFPYNYNNYDFFKDKVKTLSRNITLTSKFLDKNFKCYKGKIVGKLNITKQHLGHKIGEFFFTKILGERIAYRKRQKKLLKKGKDRMKLKKK